MVDGLTIDNMVIGGPAHNSGQLDRGDLIVAVDFKSVSEDNLQDLLVGQDIPSSSVTLTVIKSGSTTVTRDVVLTRMAIDSIADRCRMFEMFAAMKVIHAITVVFSRQGWEFI
jgi:C-terminal processing protease CtpA/Prc